MPTRLFCWGDYAEYYDYLADGTKVRHEYQDGQERFYAGSLVYDQGVFESAAFGGGRIVGTYDDSEAHYFLTDHIGSTRVVAKVTTAGRDDLDRKDYYPFGKAWTQAGMPISENRYTFSGKEQVDVAIEDGITTPIHDFGARYYDSDGVLFFQQDPLMEKYYSIGQYNYCAGNPVRLIDPTGMSSDEYYNEKGVKIYDTHEGTRTFVIRTSDDKFAGKTAITVSAAQQTEAKITNGELQGDHMQNVVEIAPISTLREARSTIKDDGKGNSSNNPDNHREYGGNILSDNSIADVSEGPTREDNGGKGSISIPGNKDSKATYHSHMSATFVKDGAIKGSSRGPSMTDYKSIQGRQGYIFQMRTQEIIVFDKSGIKATLPFSVLK